MVECVKAGEVMGEVVLKRVMVQEPPFVGHAAGQGKAPWDVVPEWPAQWLAFPKVTGFVLYRLVLRLEKPLKARIHVTADERYELYVDGELQARGSERGDVGNWFFESFDLHLPEGRHVVMARVWALGNGAPWAQISVKPGFLLAAEEPAGELLSTGRARWEALVQEGISWQDCSAEVLSGLGCGAGFIFDTEKLEPHWRGGGGGGWEAAELGELPATDNGVYVKADRHYLRPAMLRPQIRHSWSDGAMRYAAKEDVLADPLRQVVEQNNDRVLQFALAGILRGEAYKIPAHTTIRGIIDLNDYVCQYPTLCFAGGAGAVIRLRYAESLWDKITGRSMEGRDRIGGRYFRGLFDEIHADGREHSVHAPWWRAGRFVQLEVKTAGQALELKRLAFEETRAELGVEFRFSSNIPQLDEVARVALRTQQVCAHEHYMDCPYYEQLQYVGDTRLQMLLSFCLNPEARLARKALVTLEASRRNPAGLMLDASPGQGKLIPPFALWWVSMIGDYAQWRGELPLVRSLMPSAREVIDRFVNTLDERCLLVSGRGWNYVDAAEGFQWGTPPGAEQGGHSGVLQLQLVYTLTKMAELEEQFGIRVMGKHWRSVAESMLAAAEKHYWDSKRQLFADDLKHKSFSQHTQVFAVLSRLLKRSRAQELMVRTVREKDLVQAGLYFSHYLFEATSMFDGGKYFRQRIADWYKLIEQGFKTYPEHLTDTRSECHAWSAHVLYHILYTIVGIKPVPPGMQRVRIEPTLQAGETVKVSVAHPKGMIHLDLHMERDLEGTIVVPRGVEIDGPVGNANVQIR